LCLYINLEMSIFITKRHYYMNITKNTMKSILISSLMAVSSNSYSQELTETLRTEPQKQTIQIEENTQEELSDTLYIQEKDSNTNMSDSTNTKEESPRYGRININSAPYLSISSSILNNKPFIAAAGWRSKKWFYTEIEKWYNPESYKESWNYLLPVMGYSKTFWKNDQRKVHPQVIWFWTQTEWFWDKESTLILPNIRLSYLPKNRSLTARYTYAINPFNNDLDNHIAQINVTKPLKHITAWANVRYNNGVFATDPTVSAWVELTHNEPINIWKHIQWKVALVGNLNLSKRINPEMNTAIKDVFAITTTWNIK